MDMTEYYEVLHYLHTIMVDRQYPYDFKEVDEEGNPINYVVDGSAVYPTVWRNYEGVDIVEMYVKLASGVDVNNIKFNFSPLDDGNATLLSLNPIDVTIEEDAITVLQFNVDNNATMTDKSKLLTGIKSIKVDFDGNQAEIIDIVFKSRDYTYTLEDLEQSLRDGENYVLRRLNNRKNELDEIKEIPSLLQKYVYMGAGAYAWLTRWEYESKPMKEPKSESNNYADRLFGQIDSAIENYLSNIENNRHQEYIDMNFLATEKIGWGSHYGYWRCKNHSNIRKHKHPHCKP